MREKLYKKYQMLGCILLCSVLNAPVWALHNSLEKHNKFHLKHFGSSRLHKLSHSMWITQPKIIVVIDPGHGGKDPGAIGVHHIQEKDITWAIAQKLQAILRRQPGFQVVLTRQTDRYLELIQRLTLARRVHADLFIAIHADVSRYNADLHGASVYLLSPHGLHTEASLWRYHDTKLNDTFLSHVSLLGKDNILKSVLMNLSQMATWSHSLQVGQLMIEHLSHMMPLCTQHVHMERFLVLKAPDIPSLLIEVGFLSNQREARRLTSSAYQHRLALAIGHAIQHYFWRYPPQDTWLAQQRLLLEASPTHSFIF